MGNFSSFNKKKENAEYDTDFKKSGFNDENNDLYGGEAVMTNIDEKIDTYEESAETIVNNINVQEQMTMTKDSFEEECKENINQDLSCDIKDIKLLMECIQSSLDNSAIINRKITKSNDRIINEICEIKELIEKDKSEEVLELKRTINSMKNQEKDMIKNILHISDQFDCILKFAQESKNVELTESMNCVMKIVKKELSEVGIEEICALGEQFSPKFHVCEVAVEDETKESNEIINVIKKGYKRNGDVIRASRVVAVMNNEK